MFLRSTYLIAIILLCTLKVSAIDNSYKELDLALKHKDNFEAIKLQKIENLKVLLTDTMLTNSQRFRINQRLVHEYKTLSFDSTLTFVQRNLNLAIASNNRDLVEIGRLDYSDVLASSGRYTEALDVLSHIDSTNVQQMNRVSYLKTYNRIYSDLSIYSSSKEEQEKYVVLKRRYIKAIQQCVTTDSEIYLSILEQSYRDNRNLDEAERINSLRLAHATPETQNYSTIAFERSLLYRLKGDEIREEKYLILSAISDIKAAIKDNASLNTLAYLLYQRGEVDRAYRYIRHSFEDANFYNSRLRYISISGTLPLITEAYHSKTQKQKRMLILFLVSISVLSIVLIITIWIIFSQMSRVKSTQLSLKETNKELNIKNQELEKVNIQLKELNISIQDANHLKEHYIGSFLTICSDYIDKLDAFRKMVNKSIKSKKVQELYQKTKENGLLDNEMKEYYENFDSTFLHIFPSFIEEFNTLLKDDAQIHVPNEYSLTPALRIFALIRLGITDSSTIARLLHYSVNTIYNYRVKYRNSSKIPRDEFKDYVQKIGVPQTISL